MKLNVERPLTKACTLYLVEKQNGDNNIEHWYECELHPDDNFGRRGHTVPLNINFPEIYKDYEAGTFESGLTVLHSDDAVIFNDKIFLRGMPTFSRKKQSTNQRKLAVVGNRSVLAVRVQAKDSSTTASAEVLSREIFGIQDSSGQSDSFNLVSAYNQCSHGQLTFSPATYTSKNNLVKNGVYTATLLDENIQGQSDTQVRNKVLNRLEEVFGDDLNSVFDHVMLCIPPGTGNWAAYAYINGFVSVYNDDRYVPMVSECQLYLMYISLTSQSFHISRQQV